MPKCVNPDRHGFGEGQPVQATDAPASPLSPVVSTDRERLEALAKSIESITDFRTRVVQVKRGDPEVLHVVNPVAGYLSDDISCRPLDRERDESGDLWLFWSWGDEIGPADSPDAVALAVKRVLTPEV